MRNAVLRLAGYLAVLAVTASIVVASLTSPALALNLPEATGHVNDFAGMLSDSAKSDLENQLRAYNEKSGNEIAVATVDNLQGTTVEDFGVKLFEKWKIGKKGKDNGVLLLIAKKEHKVRIEVGYGLEPKLTDAQAFDIIKGAITPAFKSGDYDGGVVAGVNAVATAISGKGLVGDGSSPAAYARKPSSPLKGLSHLFYPFLFIGFAIFQWLISILGRSKSWWLGGVIGAVLGLVAMIFSVTLGIIALSMLTPLGLLLDHKVSKAYSEAKKNGRNDDKGGLGAIPWWAGGFLGSGGGGGSGDGGGFGGFGGGESGGGGASGDW